MTSCAFGMFCSMMKELTVGMITSLLPFTTSVELIEIFDGHFLDGRSFRDPCIGDKDVQAISDDAAGLPGKLVGAIRGGKVHRYGISSTTALAYLCDDTI